MYSVTILLNQEEGMYFNKFNVMGFIIITKDHDHRKYAYL